MFDKDGISRKKGGRYLKKRNTEMSQMRLQAPLFSFQDWVEYSSFS